MALSTAVFGGGCFWCTEAVFERLKGVDTVTSGYAGGHTENPTYEQVSSGTSGHAEVIKVEFDPAVINYEDLLNVFFSSHDPTTLNRQGNDIGTQYRSAIFTTDEEQKIQAEKYVEDLEQSGTFSHPLTTEIKPLEKFFPAESYHQQFYDNNQGYPYCQIVIDPKISKLRQKFAHLLKDA